LGEKPEKDRRSNNEKSNFDRYGAGRQRVRVWGPIVGMGGTRDIPSGQKKKKSQQKKRGKKKKKYGQTREKTKRKENGRRLLGGLLNLYKTKKRIWGM